MKELKQIKFKATEAFRNELYVLLKQHNIAVKTFIVDAIIEKAKRDYDVQLQPASAPHGVRNDALPVNWKSRLYRDRYQLVAVKEKYGVELIPLHQYEGETVSTTAYINHRVESPEKAEIYAPTDISARDLQLAYMEWLPND